MTSTTIKCPECGGDKTIAAGDNKYICQYCGATFVKEAPTAPASADTTKPKALCQFCGGEIVFGAQKCRHCGEWLNRPSKVAPQPIYVQNIQQTDTSSKSKKTSANSCMTIICIFVALFFFVVIISAL